MVKSRIQTHSLNPNQGFEQLQSQLMRRHKTNFLSRSCTIDRSLDKKELDSFIFQHICHPTGISQTSWKYLHNQNAKPILNEDQTVKGYLLLTFFVKVDFWVSESLTVQRWKMRNAHRSILQQQKYTVGAGGTFCTSRQMTTFHSILLRQSMKLCSWRQSTLHGL